MQFIRGRYSWVIRPFLVIYDLTIINVVAFYYLKLLENDIYFFKINLLNNKQLLFFFYSTFFWVLCTLISKFYKVYRYTNVQTTLSGLFKQFILFTIVTYAFIGFFRSITLAATETLLYLLYCFYYIGFMKLLSYYALKLFRSYLKGNNRNVIIIGKGKNAQNLIAYFNTKKELGYKLVKVFTKKTIEESYQFIKTNSSLDEIYCAMDEFSESEINTFVKLASHNKSNIKFIPKDNQLLNTRLRKEYYSYLPILSMPEVSLNTDFNRFIKRIFDVIVSLLVCIFILSWLTIILYILIKFESKGPLFYVHKRTGINFKEYDCYKFRSLRTTKEIKGSYVQKNDARLTKVGRFLRRTSIDEMPQFFNALKGDMSIVGPRPHMLTFTDAYSKVINKYNFFFRHNVKPGITGLAQIKGYRGEIKDKEDIINRIRYDLFYIDNWTLLLDLEIIFKTVIKITKGDHKAY